MDLRRLLGLLAAAATAISATDASLSPLLIPRACSDEAHSGFPFCNTSLSEVERVHDLRSRLNLHQKALLLTARASPRGDVPEIGLPEYNWGANCVHGVQSTCGSRCATNFPNPVNLGAIFDPADVAAMGGVIGHELRALWLEGARENYKAGPHLGLDCWSPNININRDPRWGRNMETPSEDPLVNARYGVAYTRGLQDGEDKRFLQAVVTLKHWVAYSLEHFDGIDRMAFNAVVTRYDFVDTYLPAFKASVVEGKAQGVMCSYNRVNGVPMCGNRQLNTDLLRDHLGFNGYITSDSGAIEGIFREAHYTKTLCDAGKLAIETGTDVNSGSVYERCLEKLVADKELEMGPVDAAVDRSLALRFRLGLFDPIDDQPYWHVPPTEVNTAASQELSLNLTRKSLVLLQNHGDALPLRKKSKIAVLGPHAEARRGIMGNYYGQICHGDYLELGCVETPLQAIRKVNGDDNTLFARGCGVNDSNTDGFAAAVAAAQAADAVVLFLGIDTSIEREAGDRVNIDVPATQLALLKAVRRATQTTKKPVTVVLFNGGVLGCEELVLHTDALLEAFYPGFFGAQAVADVLFGDYNPGGKLPVTMYRSSYVDKIDMKSMSMTAYPGRSYRYYKEVPVFPFGFGLSYTTFKLSAPGHPSQSPKQGLLEPEFIVTPDANATFEVVVANTGKREGDEVVLAFFRPLAINATGPATLLNEQLFDYRRVTLAPGKKSELKFTVSVTTLALHNEVGDLVSYPGFYELLLSNGADQRLTFVLHLVGRQKVLERFPVDAHPVGIDSATEQFVKARGTLGHADGEH